MLNFATAKDFKHFSKKSPVARLFVSLQPDLIWILSKQSLVCLSHASEHFLVVAVGSAYAVARTAVP